MTGVGAQCWKPHSRLLSKTTDLAKEFRVREDEPAKAFPAPVNTRLEGAQRDIEQTRGLLVAELIYIDEDDGLALLKRDFEQKLFEVGTKFATEHGAFGGLARVGDIDCVVTGLTGSERARGDAAAAAAVFVTALVGGNAEEPALEIAFLEPGESTECGEECLLCGIFGSLGLAKHAATETIDMGLVPVDKAVEGIKAAVLCQ